MERSLHKSYYVALYYLLQIGPGSYLEPIDVRKMHINTSYAGRE